MGLSIGMELGAGSSMSHRSASFVHSVGSAVEWVEAVGEGQLNTQL